VDKNFAVHITSPDLRDPIEAYSHHEQIETIKFLPGKKILASADTKGVYLWDLTKKVLVTISSPVGDVHCVAVTSSPSEDRVQVASVRIPSSERQYLRRWEISSESPSKPTPIPSEHQGDVSSMAFSDDGSRLATGGIDFSIHIWDASNGKHLQTLSGHSSKVVSLAFSSDGWRIASASEDGDVRVWDMDTCNSVAVLGPHDLNSESRDENREVTATDIEAPNTEIYFSDDLVRVYLLSPLKTVYWNISNTLDNEPTETGAPHQRPNPREKPKIINRKGFFRFGDESQSPSFPLLFIAFERDDKWEFIVLPTQDVVGVSGLVAICGRRRRMAISMPTESGNFLLLDISKSKSPLRTPTFVDGYETGTFNVQHLWSDMDDDYHNWEKAIDSIVYPRL